MPPPHIHLALELVSSLQRQDIGAANKKALADFQIGGKKLAEIEQEELMLLFKACRIRGCYDKFKKKLYLAVSDQELLKIMVRALEQCGGAPKYGAAPAGGLERDIQRQLNDTKDDSGESEDEE